MKYKEDIKFIEYVKSLVGKQILFKLTNDLDDEGLIGTLKKVKDNLIIERDNVDFVIELHEIHYIQEYNS